MIETENKQQQFSNNDEIDLKETFQILWDGKLIISVVTAFFAISSVFYALSLENQYKSSAILTSTDGQNMNSLGQYSGLASMAGISLPSSENKVDEVMEIIESREFVRHLVTFENILPSITAAHSYNINSGVLYYDPEIYDSNSRKWIRETSGTRPQKPSYLEAHRAYKEILSISKDKLTGFVSISIEHISPVFAKDFLALIITEANKVKRKKDIETSTKALTYLQNKLSQTQSIETKQSISNLINAQLETLMLANVNDEYSLSILEPPFVPEFKSKPSRAMICILSTLVGGILSIVLVLLRYFFYKAD